MTADNDTEKTGKRRRYGWKFWIGAALAVVIVWWGWSWLNSDSKEEAATESPPAAVVPSTETEGKEPVITQQPIEDDRVVGLAFTDAVIDLVQGELDRFLGWRPNDIIIGRVTDNVRNYQLGVLDVVRRVMLAFNDKMARFGSTYKMNEHLEKAFTDLNFSAYKFWFPSTESVYRDAIRELDAYRRGLLSPEQVGKGGSKSAFFPRGDNLIFLLGQLREVLGSCQNDLTKNREDDGSPVSHFSVDDYFYYAYGALKATLKIMKAVKIDFREEIRAKSAGPLVDDIINTLARPVGMLDDSEPMIVIDRPITSIFNNHRAQINRPVADVRQKMASLQATLAK